MSPPYYLYFEDPPYADGVPCTGLSRVNAHILRAFGQKPKGIIIRTSFLDKRTPRIDVQGHKYVTLGWVGILLEKMAARLFPRALFVGGVFLPKLLAFRLASKKTQPILFSPIGTDLGGIIRSNKIANFLGADLVLFLVDDLLENLHHEPKYSSLRNSVVKIINTSKAIFCATADLAVAYSSMNPNVHVLPMPYQPRVDLEEMNVGASNNEIVFLGNPSHFYRDGIEVMANILPRLEGKFGHIVFRGTFGEKYMRELENQSGTDIRVEPFQCEEDLAKGLAKCRIAYVPYSFSDRYLKSTESSFPSKLFEYLAYAKTILVWAPEWSSAAKFFRKHELPGLVSVNSIEEFQRVLEVFLEKPEDFSEAYQRSLTDFSYTVFLSYLEAGIFDQ